MAFMSDTEGIMPGAASPAAATAAATTAAAAPTLVQQRGMRNTIRGQAVGLLGGIAFSNGLVLLYLTQQQFSGAAIMFFLSVPALARTFCTIPSGYIADRVGLKRVIMPGAVVSVAGFALLPLSGFATNGTLEALLIGAGAAIYALGGAMFGSGWFALLQPIVPVWMRGRYFGTMRMVWQTTGLLFGVLCTFTLSKDSPTYVFQAIFAFVVLAMAARVVFISRVPELDPPQPSPLSLPQALLKVARAPNYASFCCYVFLLTLSTASSPNLFALIEKNTLRLGDAHIVWLGNALMFGAVCGFLIGGKAVDRLGAKVVFLIAHFSYGVVLIAFVSRAWLPPALLPLGLGLLNFCFGLVAAASAIAISTEMMALLPQRNKSLTTGLLQTLQMAGTGLSGLLSAAAIKLEIFSPEWHVAGASMSGYDSILLLSAVLVIVLTVALGLVPSVIRHAE